MIPWLSARSKAKEVAGGELVLRHSPRNSSILVPLGHDVRMSPPEGAPLGAFYDEFCGASVGNGSILLACNQVGGVTCSQLYIPDFDQMAQQVRKLGMDVPPDEQVFMVEAGWMFAYSVGVEDGRPILRMYDRDLGTTETVESVEDAFVNWWTAITS